MILHVPPPFRNGSGAFRVASSIASRYHMEHLVPDIWRSIFTLLPHVDLERCARVCSRWHGLLCLPVMLKLRPRRSDCVCLAKLAEQAEIYEGAQSQLLVSCL
jgi:hypothetical protein